MSGARFALLSLATALIGLVQTTARAQTLSADDVPIPPMPPSEYAVAAERSLQGLFLGMLERDTDDGDENLAHARGEMAESALRIRYDQEVARLLATTGRWTLSQRDDESDTFLPHQPSSALTNDAALQA